MTSDPRDDGEGVPLDVDAEFARIVEAYGVQPGLAEEPPVAPDRLAETFRARGWTEPAVGGSDELEGEATWDDEGHFVPPEPPPVPVPAGWRLAAWVGVIGGPLALLLLSAFNVVPPTILSVLLVAGFVGGFGYLVATMRRDDRAGDDGAVL